MPLVKPGLVATAILSIIFSVEQLRFSVILAGPNTRTLPVAVFNLMSFEQFNWGPLAAAATMITLPVLAMALVMQRHIVSRADVRRGEAVTAPHPVRPTMGPLPWASPRSPPRGRGSDRFGWSGEGSAWLCVGIWWRFLAFSWPDVVISWSRVVRVLGRLGGNGAGIGFRSCNFVVRWHARRSAAVWGIAWAWCPSCGRDYPRASSRVPPTCRSRLRCRGGSRKGNSENPDGGPKLAVGTGCLEGPGGISKGIGERRRTPRACRAARSSRPGSHHCLPPREHPGLNSLM